MRKRSFILLVLASLGLAVTAQTDNRQEILNECRRLYADGKHAAALSLIKEIDTRNLEATTLQEIELLKAVTTFEENHLEGRGLILQYMDNYPESSKRGLLGCYIAESYYHSKNFRHACEWFGKSNMKRLTKEERERATLYYALSLQECGKEENAVKMLRDVVIKSKRYANDAIFQLAVIDYDNDVLDVAERGFKSIAREKGFRLEVPYFLAGIELKRGNPQAARRIAEAFIAENNKKAQSTRMLQILGAAEFAEGNYKDAIAPLTNYIIKSDAPQRIAFYQLALCYFNEGNFDKAAPLFAECNDGNDVVAQNSLLHTGIILLSRKDNNGARMTFEQAAKMTHDSKVREEAMYNYALCLHQTRYSPFAESVKIFEQFLNDYPNSEHAKQVEGYLVEVYMNTHNYDVALQSINKIKAPSAKILKAKQKILYRLGVQEFINGDMDKAISFMDRSIELASHSKITHADALYWKGEALYRKGDYKSAANCYRMSIMKGGSNSNRAIYGIGYTLFHQKKYADARREFQHFVNNSAGEKKETVADALNRIADSHFYQRDYAAANKYYKQAIETDKDNSDYALFRSAVALGLSDDYQGKISTLTELIGTYPNSAYTEQALYEMGRAHIELEQPNEAISAFDRLTVKFPKSTLTRRATTEKAMIYNSIGERDKAIETYKDIIERYPHSEEAQIAFQDLKNIYVDMGEVEKFAAYAESTTGVQSINSNEIDALTYTAAEKMYGRSEISVAKEKFEEYLSNFPEGAFRVDAHYYLGEIYNSESNTDEALKNFEEVFKFHGNKYIELATMRAAAIYYNKASYEKASELYKQLLANSSNEERRQLARTNIMRSAQKREKFGEVVKYAGELLNNNSTSTDIRREALHNRAKAYLELDKSSLAQLDLNELAKDTRSKEGAEAKYLIAQIKFGQERYDECEEIIMDYISESTPHAYWLARSFILLSDLYSTQGRNMEAKQYLISLQNNYEGDDDIAEMIEQRLTKLAAEDNTNN